MVSIVAQTVLCSLSSIPQSLVSCLLVLGQLGVHGWCKMMLELPLDSQNCDFTQEVS